MLKVAKNNPAETTPDQQHQDERLFLHKEYLKREEERLKSKRKEVERCMFDFTNFPQRKPQTDQKTPKNYCSFKPVL